MLSTPSVDEAKVEGESEQTVKDSEKSTTASATTTTTTTTSSSAKTTDSTSGTSATGKPGELDLTLKLPALQAIEKLWYDRQQSGWKNETVKSVALGCGLTHEQFQEVLRRAEVEPSPAKSTSSVAPSPGSALADAEVAAAMGRNVTPKKVVTSTEAALRSESQELVDTITSPFKMRPSTQSTLSQGWSPDTKEMMENISANVLQGDVSKLKLVAGDAALQTPTPPKAGGSTQRIGKPVRTFVSTGEEPPTPGTLQTALKAGARMVSLSTGRELRPKKTLDGKKLVAVSDSSDSDDVSQKKTITVDSAPEVQQPEASSVRRSPLRRYSQEDREAAKASRDLYTPEVTAELGDSTLQPLVMTSRGVAQAGGKLAKAMKHLAEEERLRAERSVEQLQLMSSALVKPSTTQLPATQTVESMGKESLAAPPARDSKEAEVVMPPPPQPQTLPPITSFLP